VSEFCGVTIDDIDFHRRVLIVDKQLSITHHNEYYISRPKSQSGNRVIPLNDMALEAVQWFLDHRDTKGKDFSVDGYSDFLLLNNRGRGMNCSLLNDQFNVLTRRYNQEHKSPIKVTPHILRHTFCSNCIRSGMTPKAVQVLMGHSSFDLTMNVYTHITDQEVADQFFSVCSNIAVKP
jgi:site-specific recombinase XerD